MYKITEYEKKYEKAAKRLMVDISVKEYGFKEYEECFWQSNYNKFQKSGGNFWIVLDQNEIVIGTMALEKNKNEGYISSVYLHSEYRGLGIAQELLEIAIKYSKNNGIEKLLLSTHEKFSRAISFYEKNFVRIKQDGMECWYMLDLRKEN